MYYVWLENSFLFKILCGLLWLSVHIFMKAYIYIYQAIIPGIVAKLDLAVKKLKKFGK